MSTETQQSTAAPTIAPTEGQGQTKVEAPATQTATVDPFKSVLPLDGITPAVADYLRKGLEAGDLPQAEIDAWVRNASDRHTQRSVERRERAALHKTVSALSRGSTTKQDEPVAPVKPAASPKLREALGAHVTEFGEEAVDAFERVLDARVQAEVSRIAPQPVNGTAQQPTDHNAIAQANEERQRARLGEHFSSLPDEDRNFLLDEIQDRARELGSHPPTASRLSRGARTVEETFDRWFDAAALLVKAEHPDLVRSTPPLGAQDQQAPTSNGTGGIQPAARSAIPTNPTYEERQTVCAQRVLIHGDRVRARREAGLPPL